MQVPTQEQMFYHACRAAAETNLTFLELVKEGMTKQDLEKNIKRRPLLWGRFAGWVDKLPDSQTVWEEKNDIDTAYYESAAYYDTDLETYKSKLYEVYLRGFLK